MAYRQSKYATSTDFTATIGTQICSFVRSPKPFCNTYRVDGVQRRKLSCNRESSRINLTQRSFVQLDSL